MKTHVEELSDGILSLIKQIQSGFSESEIDRDPRIYKLLDSLYALYSTPERFEMSELVIEFDQETGKPKVNEMLAQRYIRSQIDKAIVLGSAFMEIDSISEENKRISKLVKEATAGNETARAILKHKLKLPFSMFHKDTIAAAGINLESI